MSDHINALFEGQELSEEFKTKATAIVTSMLEEKEAEIKAAVQTQLQESFDQELSERVAELEALTDRYIQEEVLPKIDQYLTLAVNEWEEDNKVGLQEGAKVALADSFLTGLVGLAESHNLKLNEGEFNKLKEVQAELDQLKESLVELKVRNAELVKENQTHVRASIVSELTESLSHAQRDKLVPVVDKVEFKDVEQFSEAVKSLIASYFPLNEKEDEEDEDEDKKDKQDKLDESTDPYLAQLLGQLDL